MTTYDRQWTKANQQLGESVETNFIYLNLGLFMLFLRYKPRLSLCPFSTSCHIKKA